jgi:hypothetical protein
VIFPPTCLAVEHENLIYSNSLLLLADVIDIKDLGDVEDLAGVEDLVNIEELSEQLKKGTGNN